MTPFDAHYVYHPAWATRIVADTNTRRHVDISSTLSFSTILSAFVPVDFYDFRPANLNLSNLSSKHADLTSLPFGDCTIGSLSCMHVVEHIGLGRYGDEIDPSGDMKAMGELQRVLAVDGNLLFVVPVGRPRLAFNAHRVYSYEMILNSFPRLELRSFALIPDNAREVGIIENAAPSDVNKQTYGCGCFWFTKPEA